ncbi:hypothetical protein GCM10009837_85510 [Streptomyces durmitorensis]|uniref:Major Facilitator Superfamily protein n=1 Tax=Streptomyces durmitorensis TaxID=319947 RepID=A0ABY4PP67_9ACTN|nr:hypothetical protein [Streptomyces durmitorensis]UQT54813.1 hypothetical protein M4V62_06735 [Streptomyces durmitorensis]
MSARPTAGTTGTTDEADEASPSAAEVRRALFTSPRFLVLWAAMLISSTGTFFLLLTASSWLLTERGSGLSAAAVFGFQWILPVLLVGVIRKVCEGQHLRRTVIYAELGGGAVSLAIGIFLGTGLLGAVLGCFLVRGLLEGITKTARVVYARQLFEGPGLKLASYTFNNSYYLGSAAGGVLGSVLAGEVSVVTAGAIDAVTFALSACCYRWLPAVSAPRAEGTTRRGLSAQVRATLSGRRGLTRAVVYLVLAVGVFQGFHSAARTVVPVRVLGQGESGVMNLQIVAGFALVLGAVTVPVVLRRVKARVLQGFALNAVTAAVMFLVCLTAQPWSLYVAYFGFLFLFEFAFTAAQGEVVQKSPATDLVALTSFVGAAGTGMLIVSTLLAGVLFDSLALSTVGLLYAAVVLTVGIALEVFLKVRPAPTPTPTPTTTATATAATTTKAQAQAQARGEESAV